MSRWDKSRKKEGHADDGRLVLASILVLFLTAAPVGLAAVSAVPQGGGAAETTQAQQQQLVPTQACACTTVTSTVAGTPAVLRGHRPPISTNYDEQEGITFTQSFTALEYNVTAVEQSDPTLGTGPAYLLNGLSDSGYWYQVGLAWNWNPGTNPGTGFDMTYEVFDQRGDSVFPQNGDGGLISFSGTVNQGDNVTLNLYFSNSSQVVMFAEDTKTGATASETYSTDGGTYFVGLPDAVANSNGYFTGLMTEWYHGTAYYGNGEQVVYSNPKFQLGSGWMWLDEFDATNNQLLFSDNTSAPVWYTPPTQLQELAFNGTTIASDAYEFVTGPAPANTSTTTSTTTSTATSTATGTVPLTFGYTVQGGGTGYSQPELTYVTNGERTTVPLGTTPSVYEADAGSGWNVSLALPGSTSTERWQTDQPSAGVANSSETVEFTYYDQLLVGFSLVVSGGGTGYSQPSVAYDSFGASQSTSTGVAVWADAGSGYSYTNPLQGSTSGERWDGASSGTVKSAGTITATYYHQYLVVVDVSFNGSELFPSLTLTSTSAGEPLRATVVQGSTSVWLDANSSYSIPQDISLSQGERWTATTTSGSATNGSVSSQLTIHLQYERQDYVALAPNAPTGGSISVSSGWYDAGATVQVGATANPGWRFEGWEGTGTLATTRSSSASSSATNGTTSGASSSVTSILVNGPVNETAVFYPELEVVASGPRAVSYHDGAISGTVPAGTTADVYLPPSSSATFRASPPVAPFYSFEGWGKGNNNGSSSISFVVSAPLTLEARSTYNYANIGGTVIIVTLIALAAAFVLVRRRHHGGSREEAPPGGAEVGSANP